MMGSKAGTKIAEGTLAKVWGILYETKTVGESYVRRTPVKRFRSPLGGLQTLTGTIDRDLGAFRECSRH